MRRIMKIFSFRSVASICVITTGTGLAFQASNSNSKFVSSSSDTHSASLDFEEKFRTAVYGFRRSSRAISTISLVVLDYKYSLHGLVEDSEEYRLKLSEVHLRSAKRLLKLCQVNKGFYVKAGQFAASLRQTPNEYSSILSSLQDQAVPCPFKDIKGVLINNLGSDISAMFLSLDEQPIAAASIAQVHRAILKSNQEVAIKVQYPGLMQHVKIDTTVMSFLSRTISWLFPDYRFDWLVSEFEKTILSELGVAFLSPLALRVRLGLSTLDFMQEARNAEGTSENFKKNNLVKIPQVYWEFTTRQVLTMEFCEGHKVDDIEFMKQSGIEPSKVAKALVEVFAEMIFVHGFVHGDPHPGNILVSLDSLNDGFTLVLLDHGIYKQLDEEFRLNYCRLWKAMITLDTDKILQLGEWFGVPKYSKYFPLIFTGRSFDSTSAIGMGMSNEEKRNLKQELKLLKMEDISSFMESLPSDFLTVLRTDALLRSIMRKLGVSQRVRILTYAKFALHGSSPKLNPATDAIVKVAYFRLKTCLSYLHLRLILAGIEALPSFQKFMHFMYSLCKRFFHAMKNIQMLSFP
ncbi:aarF domain-containing protein kinase 1 isoform X2 [Benincasa hispida]|uniref:aarF domain-containing protein kinase 1 isoform X2 n=1 Tax=Benincasa hispida TaxID=102211 RepID=UPI001902559D|nr:aarF domain-containing protein kinase 1 isoform X2 [Benincasa hispida]